jgi:GTPase Era involved in 16S rRNA processing
MGKLKAFIPPTGAVAKYKVCLFGLAGAGKSAFVNAVLTLASSGMSVVETAGVGGCARHNTRQLATYTIDGENFALVDTWGLTLTTYLNDDLENVVDGVFPRNWGMDMIYDQHAKAIRDNASTRPERAVHVILFMITHSALDKNDECELIKANYARLQDKAARNPLVLISKVDEIVPAFRSNPLGDYPEVRALKQKVTDLLGIPENRVYAVVNYKDESERSFQIDRNTYRIVEHALRTASENLRRVAEEPPTTFEW